MRILLVLGTVLALSAGTLAAQFGNQTDGSAPKVPTAAERLRNEQRQSLVAMSKRLEKYAKRFSKQFDKELDKSILEDTKYEQTVDKRADQLKDALGDVSKQVKKDHYEDGRQELDRAMQFAHDVNEVMVDRRFSQQLEQDWVLMVADLNVLAGYYGLDPL